MKKSKFFIFLLAALSLVLVGCSTNNGVDDDNNTPPVVEDDNGEEDSDQDQQAITEVDAYDIFIEKYDGAKVYQVQYDGGYREDYYKVEGSDSENEYELKLRKDSGEEVDADKELFDDVEDDIEITKADVEKISSLIDKAKNEASANATVEEWTLETDDNRLVFEIEFEEEGLSDLEITYDFESEEVIEKDN